MSDSRKPRLARKAKLKYDDVRKADLLLLPERVVKLNASSAAILKLCDGKRTVADIVAELSAQYEAASVESDVVDFLSDMEQHRWVEF